LYHLYCTAVSNGANITDGLDGLADGTSALLVLRLAFLPMPAAAFFCRLSQHHVHPQSRRAVHFYWCVGRGVHWFFGTIRFPAQVFMGDTGSLTLGGIIAALAIIVHKELLIPIDLRGVFVETLSVTCRWLFQIHKEKIW
jgi:phospho-N-acetylmuramoyl-pentapeptide-transferase